MFIRKIAFVIVFISLWINFFSESSFAQRKVEAIKVENTDIKLDGKLTEKVWNTKPLLSNFIQSEPFQGTDASFPFEGFIAYSEDALYLSGRVFKSKDDIQSVVSRRDNSANSERIIFSFDTFLDKITSYSFGITASAVRLDYYHSSDNAFDRDYSWNPVWEAKTVIDSTGWTFEAKIPFSQLRFTSSEELVFGLNVNHYSPSTNEDTFWVFIPRNEAGWASHFDQVSGIKDVENPKRTEILPYYAGDLKRFGNPDADNPFSDTYSFTNRIGGDIKVGIGSNLTFDATINPDFGQVEADPAFVNLTQFEVIQSERRPFFTEGASLFNGGGSRFFYSRRIGARPHYYPDADYVSMSSNTSILGASKITGRFSNGLSVGVLSALTGNEYASIYSVSEDKKSRVLSEPLTNYSIIRLQQEFGKYGSRIGFISTGVFRNMNENSELDKILNRQAYSAGLDWMIRLDKRMYEFRGNVGLSTVQGSKEVILSNQTGSARYFQRPDATHISLDSSKTSLTGFTNSLSLSKVEGDLTWNLSYSTESPEFELNDLGVLQSADDVVVSGRLGYRSLDQNEYYNMVSLNIGGRNEWNYGGVLTNRSMNFNFEYVFPSFSRFGIYAEHSFDSFSDDKTRGGPLMKKVKGDYINLSVSSNRGASITTRITTDYYKNAEGSESFGIYPTIQGLLGGRWEFTISPRYSYGRNNRQYLTQINRLNDTGTYGKRYVFSEVKQFTFSLQTRLNMAITPDLSLELYAEPFVSDGKFSRIGELAESKTNQIAIYGETPNTSIEKNDSDTFIIKDGIDSFEISNPDFRVLSFRSNFVIRYEWIPGSTLFFVWQQSRRQNDLLERTSRASDLFDTFQAVGDHVIALKVSYWIPANRIFH